MPLNLAIALPMLCRHLVLLTALAFTLGAHAREPKAGAIGQRLTDPAVTRIAEVPMSEDLLQQRRREVLRQATRAQMEENAGTPRQLSPQERAELRQQLQQQRLELLK